MLYFNIFAFTLIFLIILYSANNRQYALLQIKIMDADFFTRVKPYIFIFICALALFSRLYEFPNLPIGINQDEAMAAVNAKALLTYGQDLSGLSFPVYLPAWGTSQMNLLESLLMMPVISVLGMNALSTRLPMLLASLASIAVVYGFVKRLFGDGAAFACVFFISINPWHIMLSRWGLESNLFPVCVLCGFYFMYRGATENKPSFLCISMLFWGASMYAYGIAYFATPFILFISVVYLLKYRLVAFKTAAICFFIYVVISFPIFLMMIVNYFKLPSISLGFLTIPYFPDAERMNDVIFGSGGLADQARNNFLYFIRNLFQYPDVPWNLIPEFGTLYIFSIPLVLYGFMKLKSGSASDFFIKLWLAAALLTGMIINTAGTNQINILFIPLIILCSIALNEIFQSGKMINRDICVIDLMPFAVYIIAFVLFMTTYAGKMPGYQQYRFYDGFGESVIAADQSDGERLYITSWTQHEYAAHVSEILTLYHCDIDSRYYRGITAHGEIPYSEKYQYVKFTQTPEYDASAVYVINAGGDGYLFPDTEFDITGFGEYAVAKRKIL